MLYSVLLAIILKVLASTISKEIKKLALKTGAKIKFIFHSNIITCVENSMRYTQRGFPGGADGKDPCANARHAGDVSLIPWVEKVPGRGHGNPHQYSCLVNPMDRVVWPAIVTKSWTELKHLSTHARTEGYWN